jgi:hypothetical protein
MTLTHYAACGLVGGSRTASARLGVARSGVATLRKRTGPGG